MSKEKEMLKAILANTNAILEHLKIKGPDSQEKKADKDSSTDKPSAVKRAPSKKKESK